MIIISIPKYIKINDDRGDYTTFEIHTAKPGGTSVIEKRYSNFRKLDKKLREIGIDTPHLPPKTLMNKSAKLLESRRKGLERYLQTLVDFNVEEDVFGILSEFLETHLPTSLPYRPRGASSADELETDEATYPQTTHQSVLLFTNDPVMQFYTGKGTAFLDDWNSIPDTVIRGAMDGLYKDDSSDSPWLSNDS